MAIKMLDRLMYSSASTYVAVLRPDGWCLSWVPGRVFSRDQATTGIVLAEAVACATDPQDRIWDHVRNWLAELGLTGEEMPAATSVEAAEKGGDQ